MCIICVTATEIADVIDTYDTRAYGESKKLVDASLTRFFEIEDVAKGLTTKIMKSVAASYSAGIPAGNPREALEAIIRQALDALTPIQESCRLMIKLAAEVKTARESGGEIDVMSRSFSQAEIDLIVSCIDIAIHDFSGFGSRFAVDNNMNVLTLQDLQVKLLKCLGDAKFRNEDTVLNAPPF